MNCLRMRIAVGVRATAWCCVALVSLACGACDGDRSVAAGREPTPRRLRLVSSDLDDGVHTVRGAIRLEFDRPLDAGSVGARSVSVQQAGGPRLRRVRVWSAGATLFVAPLPDRSFPANVDLGVRIEGGGSPRSLRSADGTALADSVHLPFRALERRRTDLEGPRLLASEPAAGSADIPAASHVQLVFDEPLARASVRSGEAVRVRVNGRETPARLRLSPDLTRLVVRPKLHLPPGADVSVDVLPALLDLLGNPAEPASVRFATRATRLRELAEDFVTTDMRDEGATTGGWAEPLWPGCLVARAGRLRWLPVEDEGWTGELPDVADLRFQVLFPAHDAPRGMSSALRVYLVGARAGDVVARAAVEAGPASLWRVDPTFDANRRAATLAPLTVSADALAVEVDEAGDAYIDVSFDAPLVLRPAWPLLVDVALTLPVGVRVAATDDPGFLALVEHLGAGVAMPAVALLVGGGPPQARSTWWDSGVERPGWQEAIVSGPTDPDDEVCVEFQTAASTLDGHPDLGRVSEWGRYLAQQPALRFVRFRVTFARLGTRGREPRIDRLVLPYQE